MNGSGPLDRIRIDRTHNASPSYHQVTEPICARASYRWKRYEKHPAPVMDKLAPHTEYFRYREYRERGKHP